MPVKVKSPPPLTPEQSVSEALTAILRHDFTTLLAWQDIARSWEDIEGVHQTRVALRRLRSALSLFANAVPREVSNPWREELRWIAGQLGGARDLDVFIDEGLSAVRGQLQLPGEPLLRELAINQRARCYHDQVVPMLDSDRYQQLIEQFPEWFEARAWEQATLTDKQRARLTKPISGYARKRLDRLARQVLTAGAQMDREDSESMHALRIECKKLRYAAEFFRSLFDGMGEFIGHLKGLQDLLGVMHDVAVTRHLLDNLLGTDTRRELLLYAGALIGWRECHYRQLSVRFDAAWAELAAARRPWWEQTSVPISAILSS